MIKKEWLDGRICIYNADCVEVMGGVADKEIDLILTDPPYGGACNAAVRGRFEKYENKVERKDIKHWDIAPEQKIFEEMFRISKNQIIWGGNYFELPATRCFLIWKKLTISENFSMAMAEYAWTSFNKNAKIFEAAPQDPERFHPTQKPVGLMNWCLLNNSKEDDLIFDGFLGSGTTAISCIRTKRRLIGCELDPIYFEKMCERIETELRQRNLF